MSSIVTTLTSGLELHLAGRLAEAEQIYRQVLAAAPNEAHAWYLLGTLQHQQGQHDLAEQYLRHSVALLPNHPLYHSNLGAVYSNRGRFEEAAAEYLIVLQLDPNAADAYVSLGNVRLQQKRYAEAISSYQQAVALAPQHATASLHLANCLEAVGQGDQALEVLESRIQRNPTDTGALGRLIFLLHDHGRGEQGILYSRRATELAANDPRTHNCLGVSSALLHRCEDAIVAYRAALALDPGLGDAWNNLGAALHEVRRFDEAVNAYQQALQINDRNSGAHYNLADTLKALGRTAEAIQHYRRAIELLPSYSKAYNNLGAALQDQGYEDDARDCYAQAIRHNPRSAAAHNNLGNVLRCLGQPLDSINYIEQALALRPDFAEAHNNLALALREIVRFDDAVVHLERALAIKPDFAEAHANLGDLWRERSLPEEARASYARSEALARQDGLKIRSTLALPIIPPSADVIDRERARIARGLEELEASALEIKKPVVDVGMTAFYLAYHGQDDLDLQRAVARVCLAASPVLSGGLSAENLAARSHIAGRRPRVGIVSNLFREHTIGHLNIGLIQHLSRERFEVVLFVFSPPKDSFAEKIYNAADRVVRLTGHLERARERVLAEQIDVLFYPDIGMEPASFFLAFSRLAPVQCVTWGHPVTTGIPAIDYFVSDVDLEPPGAESHYSEQLVRLNHLPTYFYPPQLPDIQKTRADFGLDASQHLYFCAQSLFKLQPDFDVLLKGILTGDKQALILLLDSNTSEWNRQIRARLAQNLGEDFSRVRFLPRMPSSDFLNLQALVDVSLDTTHFSGGRTSFDALALGIPVVTLPGRFMRGRVTYACYRKMGMMECVAQTPQDYIDIAVRLGTDRAWHDSIRSEILARNHVLYENREFLTELEQFFLDALDSKSAANR